MPKTEQVYTTQSTALTNGLLKNILQEDFRSSAEKDEAVVLSLGKGN